MRKTAQSEHALTVLEFDITNYTEPPHRTPFEKIGDALVSFYGKVRDGRTKVLIFVGLAAVCIGLAALTPPTDPTTLDAWTREVFGIVGPLGD